MVKRDDLYTLAPGTALQGNKVRKLLPVLEGALARAEAPLLVSFGGAYSNHLSALATAGKVYGLPIHLFVRGEEVDNPVLRKAVRDGAILSKISRAEYKKRGEEDWLRGIQEQLSDTYDRSLEDIWLILEGGTSEAAVLSVGDIFDELLTDLGRAPDYILVSAGTGGTAAGIIRAADPATRIEVFPALKGNWMAAEIRKWIPEGNSNNWTCIEGYAYGGYGKFPQAWSTLNHGLAKRADIGELNLPPLEPIYTAKLFSGVFDRIRKGHYPRGATIVVIHTGGIY